jgi:hypothetical protein
MSSHIDYARLAAKLHAKAENCEKIASFDQEIVERQKQYDQKIAELQEQRMRVIEAVNIMEADDTGRVPVRSHCHSSVRQANRGKVGGTVGDNSGAALLDSNTTVETPFRAQQSAVGTADNISHDTISDELLNEAQERASNLYRAENRDVVAISYHVCGANVPSSGRDVRNPFDPFFDLGGLQKHYVGKHKHELNVVGISQQAISAICKKVKVSAADLNCIIKGEQPNTPGLAPNTGNGGLNPILCRTSEQLLTLGRCTSREESIDR